TPKRVHQGRQDAGSARANRMPKSHGTAVDVHFGVWDIQFLHGDHGDDTEGFVDLVKIDVFRFQFGFVQRSLNGLDGRRGEPLWILGKGAVGDDARQRLKTFVFYGFLTRQNEGGGTIVDF